MPTIKLNAPLPMVLNIGDERYGICRFNVHSAPDAPAEIVLAAGRQSGSEEEFEGGVFDREIDLSEFYRTELDFETGLKNGFSITDGFFEQTDVKRLFVGLSDQGYAKIN